MTQLFIGRVHNIFGEFYEKIYCDHITLKLYNKDIIYQDGEFSIGEIIKFRILGYCMDENAQVFICGIDQKSTSKIPYLTISTKQKIDPRYSNFLISGKMYTNLNPIEFSGIIRNKVY